MSERPFEDLHRELKARLEQKLEAIEAAYRTEAEALEQQLTRHQQRQLEEAKENHKQRLQRMRLQAERQWRSQARQTVWACQHACVGEILDHAREQLAAQSPPPDYLEQWYRKISVRLPSLSGAQRLRVSPAWAEQLEEQELHVSTAPLLGGAVLEVPDHHLEIDGSWDLRLQRLTPQLWQRWLDHVGADDSD